MDLVNTQRNAKIAAAIAAATTKMSNHRERWERAAMWGCGHYFLLNLFMFALVIGVGGTRSETRENVLCETGRFTTCIMSVDQVPLITEVFDASLAATNVGWIIAFGNIFTFIPSLHLSKLLDESTTTKMTTSTGKEITVADFFCAVRPARRGTGCLHTMNRYLVALAYAMLTCLLWLIPVIYFYVTYRAARSEQRALCRDAQA